ncbi:50S ribosomal protein L9 [bacterium]|nr:50S ribosomal protein L9 [bacterium]
MRIVLLDDIVNLGEAGTVVTVKDGYARNFLIPRQLAEVATKDAMNRVTLIRRAAESKRARRKAEAADKFASLADKSLTIAMKAGTQSRLFGAVTAQTIVDEALKQLGVTIERRHVVLDEPIKHLGEYTVALRASADVTGELKVVIEPEGPKGQRSGGRNRHGSLGEAPPPAPAESEPTVASSEGASPAAEAAPAEEPAGEAIEEKYEELEK